MNDFDALVGGICEAAGLPPNATTTRQRQRVLLAAIDGSSAWPPEGALVSDWARYATRVRRPTARWKPPTEPTPPGIVDWFAGQLHRRHIDCLRVRVEEPAGWADLRSRRFESPRSAGREIAVGAFVEHRVRRSWRWQWPLRVGVLAGPDAAAHVRAIEARRRYLGIYEVFESDGRSECEFLVVPAGAQRDDLGGAAVVVIVGARPGDQGPHGPQWPFERGAVATIVSPPPTPDWFERLVVELSHDRPLDEALRHAEPDSALFADPQFVLETTVRQWGHEFADRLEHQGWKSEAHDLRAVVLGRFDSEHSNTAEIAEVSTEAAAAGVDVQLQSGHLRAATAEAQSEPDDRRLQTAVRVHGPPGKKTITDRFVPGADHDIRVCIAAELRTGATAAAVPFPHPDPGMDVKLQVSIIVAGKRTKRTLTLPATADSRWTVAAPFTVPEDADGFRIDVEVAHNKRVLQSATLADSPFVLAIDEAPLGDPGDRAA